MPVIFPVDNDRVGVLHQRAPTENGDADFALQGAGEGREARAFQNHRAHFWVRFVKLDRDGEKFGFGFGVIRGGRIGSQTRRPEVVELLTAQVFHRAADDVVRAEFDSDGFQVMVGQVFGVRHQNPDHATRADDLLCHRNLQQAGHEDGNLHARRHLALEVGEVSALGDDGAAAEFLQLLRGL